MTLFRLGDAQVIVFALVKLIVVLAVIVAFTRRFTSFIDCYLELRPSFDVRRFRVTPLIGPELCNQPSFAINRYASAR